MTEFSQIIKSIKTYLETDKLAGMEEILIKRADKGKIRINKDKEGEIREDKGEIRGYKGQGNKGGFEALEDLRKKAEECKGCQLYKRRTNLVFGSGNPDAKFMLVGEAPGVEEDLRGEPFVGRAGELLTKIIEAIGLRREDVYIANILKCRPPNNRSPLPDEISSCSPFVLEQIKIIKPKIICALGKFAAQFLIKSSQPITLLRGKFYELDDIKVMPTFHPAYLLRNPNDKKLVWEDFKKIRDALRR